MEQQDGTSEKITMSRKPSSGRIKKPPGIMSEYHTEDFGRRVEIHFDNDFVRGESILVDMPKNTTLPEKRKIIYQAINQHRPALELAALSRREGFATFEMSRKWGGRLLSDAEKKQVNDEMTEHIRQLFKSPLSREGRKLNESFWKKKSGGWRRLS